MVFNNMMANMDKNPPLVSVIVACFNSEKYLAQTIESVLSQTYTNWELIAVNDCSTDSTRDLLVAAAQLDARIRLIDREQRGGRPSITKNTGFEHAKGDYIAFLDHDDLYLPSKIESMVDALETHSECVAAFHDIVFIDKEGQETGRYIEKFTQDAVDYLAQKSDSIYVCSNTFYIFQSLRYAALHTISCMIARHRVPQSLLYFDTQYKVCDDTDLWIRLGLAGAMVFDRSVHAQYRIHDSNITRNTLKVHADITLLLENNRQRVNGLLSGPQQKLLQHRLARSYADLGWSLRQEKKPWAAANAYRKSWVLMPRWATLVALGKSGLPPQAA